MKRLNKLIVLAILLTVALAAVSFVFLLPGNSAVPKIWTDRSDYPPDSIVTIYGNNFLPNTAVTVNVTWPDGSLHVLSNIWTDNNGNFTATHRIGAQKITYNVTATDGTNTAKTKFTDSTLGLDAYDIESNGDDASYISCTISTQNPNDVIYCILITDCGTISSLGGTWSNWTVRKSWPSQYIPSYVQIYCYNTTSNGKLSGAYVSFSATSRYYHQDLMLFAISGSANPSNPFDSNAASVALWYATSATPTVKSTISGSNDFVLGVASTLWSGTSHTISQGNGTLIGRVTQPPSCAAEYQKLSSGTNMTFSLDSSDNWIAITDAFAGPPSYSVTFTQSGLGSDASGTVVTINGTAKTYSLLPNITTVNSGDSLNFSYASTVSSSTPGKQYVLTGANATSPLSNIVAGVTITGTYKTQYSLTVSGGNAPSGQGWYDSGSTATASSTWIWNTVSGQSRTALTNWQLDGSNQNPARSNTGNLTTTSITMTGNHTVNFVSTAQYFLLVNGGNSLSYGTGSPTSDNWYDSGASTTVISNWVWSTVTGQSRTAISNYAKDGTNQTPSRSGSGTLTTSSVSFSSSNHTISFTSLTQYYLNVNGGNGTTVAGSQTSDQWFDSGTSGNATSNYVWNSVAGQSRTNLYEYQIDTGSWTSIIRANSGTYITPSQTMSTNHTINFGSTVQYYLTENGGSSVTYGSASPTSDNWYDNGNSTTVSTSWVWSVTPGQSRTALNNYYLDTIAQNPTRSNTGTYTTPSVTMSTYRNVTFYAVTQYYLAVIGGSGVSVSGSQTSDQWFDSGTSGNATSNYAWNLVPSQSRNNLYEYKVDSGSWNAITRSNTGTYTTPSQTMSTYHTITFGDTVQYYLTQSGGDSVTYGSASPTSDNWYDNGNSTTVSTSWVWSVTPGQSRTALNNYYLDTVPQNPTRSNAGTYTTPSVTMSTYRNVTFTSTTQYYLTVNGGNTITFGTASPTGDQWYDSGGSTTVSSYGVWSRSGGTGQRAASWNLDGGGNSTLSSIGTVTTSSVSMTIYHTVNFNSVTQYQVTLDSGATSALFSITSPTVSSDTYWYDTGTPISVVLNGVYGRGSGTGTRLTNYYLNGGSANPVSTTSTVTVFNAAISNHEYVTTSTATQYQVTLDSGATSALSSLTSPTISGDNYWYDGGTSVTLVLNGVYGRISGTGTRLMGYQINGGTNNPVSTAGTVTVLSSLSIGSAQSITTTTGTQYLLTVTGGHGVTYGTASPTGDNWYDSTQSTTVSSDWVWGTSGGTRSAVSNWNLDGGANQNPTRQNTGTLTTSNVSMSAAHTVNFVTVTQYYLTVNGGSGISVSGSQTGDQWFDSGTSGTATSNYVWNSNGQSRNNLYRYNLDGGSWNAITRANAGTYTTPSITMSTYHTVNFGDTVQYYLTVTGGNNIAYGTASPTGDNWYDNATSTTVSSDWVWNTVPSESRKAITNYAVDGFDQDPTREYAGTLTTSSVTMSTNRTVAFASVTQYYVVFRQDGVGGDYSANFITVNGTGHDGNGYSSWTDSGSIYNFAYSSPLLVSANIKQYVLTGVNATSGFTVSAADTVTGSYETQYYVTFSSSGVGVDFSGDVMSVDSVNYTRAGHSGWYDSGASVSFSFYSPLSVDSRKRYVFVSADASSPLNVSSAQTVTGTYKTQWYITVNSAHGSPTEASQWVDADSGFSVSVTNPDVVVTNEHRWNLTALTVDSVPRTLSNTVNYASVNASHSIVFSWTEQWYLTVDTSPSSVNGPTGQGWYNAGSLAPISTDQHVDIVSGSSRYSFSGWTTSNMTEIADPSSLSTTVLMDEAKTVTANYVTQYKITFGQTGVGVDFSGDVVNVDGTNYTRVGTSFWWDDTSSHSFAFYSPLVVTADGKRYVWDNATGLDNVQIDASFQVSGSGTVSGNYKTQFYLTVDTSPSGVDSPTGQSWYDTGVTAHVSTALYVDIVSGSSRYRFDSWTGASGGYSDAIVTMDSAKTVTANYVTQYKITFGQSGVGVDFAGTVVTVDNANYTVGNLASAVFWWDDTSSHSFAFYSPLVVTTDGKQYVWDNTTGLSSAQTDASFVVSAAGSVTGNYKTQYYLTVNSDYGSPTGEGWYDEGSSANFGVSTPDSSEAGTRSVFTGWSSSDSGGYSGSEASYSVTMDNPITETASWQTQYYLTVNSAHGSPTGQDWYNASDTANFSVTSPDGVSGTRYVFTAWSGNSTSTDPIESIVMTGPASVTANWQTQYELTVTSAYGTPNGAGWYNASDTAHAGLDVGTVGTSGTRYVFTSWGTNASGTDYAQSNDITMDGPKTATAGWQTQYELTVTSAHGSPTGAGWYNASATADFGVSSPDGVSGTRYVFTAWSGNSTSTNPSDSIVMTGPASVTANWQLQYEVTFDVNPGGSGTTSPSGSGNWYDAGSSSNAISASAYPGYIFASWSKTGTIAIDDTASSSTTFTIDSPGTITAEFTQIEYLLTVAVNPTNGGSVLANQSAPYHYGDVVNLTATANPGYSFSHWTGDLFGSSNPASITIDDNKTVTAVFTQNTYTISVNVLPSSAEGSVIADKPGPYHYGDIVKLTETPAVGFSFLGWSGDGSGMGTTRTVNVTEDMTVNASFGPAVFVVPENTVSALLAFAACFAGFGVFFERENLRKLRKNVSLRVKQAQRGSSS